MKDSICIWKTWENAFLHPFQSIVSIQYGIYIDPVTIQITKAFQDDEIFINLEHFMLAII